MNLEKIKEDLRDARDREIEAIIIEYNNDDSNEMQAEIASARRKCGYLCLKWKKRYNNL